MLNGHDDTAPCDACQRAPHCARTGSVCSAFGAYVSGRRWRSLPRVPQLDDEQLADVLIGEAAIALDE
jgi:hypothetical protein